MNNTPWFRTCVQKGVPSDEVLVDVSQFGNLLLAPPSRMSYRSVTSSSLNWYGISFNLGRMMGGSLEESYSWDDLDMWSVVPPSWHTWSWAISCNKFYLYEIGEESCMYLYNLFIFYSCLAHYHVSRRYPYMKQGVYLGYLEPGQRMYYDHSGFPNERFSQLSIDP